MFITELKIFIYKNSIEGKSLIWNYARFHCPALKISVFRLIIACVTSAAKVLFAKFILDIPDIKFKWTHIPSSPAIT